MTGSGKKDNGESRHTRKHRAKISGPAKRRLHMRREQNVDPPPPSDEPEPPQERPHDLIEPDPMNPKSVPSLPATEPQPGEPPNEDWDWAEHED